MIILVLSLMNTRTCVALPVYYSDVNIYIERVWVKYKIHD